MQRLRLTHVLLVSSLLASMLAGAGSSLLAVCGPFTDVAADAFCPLVLEIFYLGITTGTTATSFDPAGNVSRLQMAAFLSRTVDGTLKRGGKRAALKQFWTTQGGASLGVTTLGGAPPGQVESDGTDLWVAVLPNRVQKVQGSTGKILETWTGADGVADMVAAMGRMFAAGRTSPGRLYRIDPSQPAGSVTTVASTLGNTAIGIAFDGGRIWTTNVADNSPASGSVSIVTPVAAIPWTVTNVSLGFNLPYGILHDGTNIWVTDILAGTLLKLDSPGAVLQTVTVGNFPSVPVFDGANIWVPSQTANSVSVVRASNGVTLATLTGNGLDGPNWPAFDGQRVLVTNYTGNSVSLWKAADLTTIGTFPTGPGTNPYGACSDGAGFWLILSTPNQLARF